LKFDQASKRLEISVRELAAEEGFGRIGFERGEGWHRLGLGAELHVRVLRERRAAQPGYRSEVYLQSAVQIDGWTAVITGRLDGCVRESSGAWLIEEFKSAHLADLETRRAGAAFARHQRQLLFYCELWRRLGHSPVSGRLVYVDLASGEESVIPAACDPEEQERGLERRLRQLLAIGLAEAESRREKAAAAAALPFPHAAPRPGQKIMMDAVRRALEAGENLIAEAATGSGKTAASLHPALAHGLAAGRQVFFLTSKTLQQTMAVSALRAMNPGGAFRSMQIRAKEKMCANDRVLCHEDFCPYARDYPEKMERSKILDRLRRGHFHFDPDIVFAEAKKEKVCPFEAQLELAGRADAIVADYNYVFEPGVALRRLEPEDEPVLLVDEAHNLPDRARKIFSPELLEESFRAVQDSLLLQTGELFDALSRTLGRVIALLAETGAIARDGGGPPGARGFGAICEIDPPAEPLRALWMEWEPDFIRYLAWKREAKAALPDDPIVDCHFTWRRFMAVLNLGGPGFTCVAESRAAGARLAVVCLDPARPLAPVFAAAASAILLSATLSPVEVIRRALGLEAERTRAIMLPPPFPRENRKIMILPQVGTAFAHREKNFAPIARLVAEMSDAQPGNALVLFPSYQFLEKVAGLLPSTRARVLAQRPDLSEAGRRRIFEELAAPPPPGILLLAVLGGMYAEGVDYPGELLSAVFIVSPALPQVSFERELLRRYFEETERAGFEYAYLQPGMTRVIQAAGRLIRGETDFGVIALLCRRFLQEPYASRLPRDWYDGSPLELAVPDPAGEIRKFFAGREMRKAPHFFLTQSKNSSATIQPAQPGAPQRQGCSRYSSNV
jgi:DNA excision repair protein ERCC-2